LGRIEFNFDSNLYSNSTLNISFLGRLLDKKDFLFLYYPKKNFSGQNKRDELSYIKVSNLILDKELEKKDYFLEKLTLIKNTKPPLEYENKKVKASSKEEVFSILKEKEKVTPGSVSKVTKQKLENPFFYKELPAPIVEAELDILAGGKVLVIKRIKSSGDLEVDLFVLKAIRRRIYLKRDKASGLGLRRVRIFLDNIRNE
jgi:hypothetical protein